MTEQSKVTWQMMTVAAPTTQIAPAQETYTVRRIQKHERQLHDPVPALVPMPKPVIDIDAERLRESLAALPGDLRAEFTVAIPRKQPAFYIQKRVGEIVSSWSMFALHIDPIYGQWQGRALPRAARKWLGRTSWATCLMIAHEVPAWCLTTYPDPQRIPVMQLVSDIAGITTPAIDPVLYGAVVCGKHWAFVKLAEWRL